MHHQETETFGCRVTRVMFSGDDGFRIIKVKTDKGAERALLGALHDAVVGATMKVTASASFHPRFGAQWKVERAEVSLPTDREGAATYLSESPALNLAQARRLCTKLGEDVWGALESVDRLVEVGKMKPPKARQLVAWFRTQRALKEAWVTLGDWGLKRHQIRAAVQALGVDLLPLVTTNPWLLAEEVDGVGLVTCDEAARRLGLPMDGEQRGRAVILHLLREDTQKGHCFSLADCLGKDARELGVPSRVSDEAVTSLAQDGKTWMVEEEDRTLVYLSALAASERYVADEIRRRAQPVEDAPEPQVDLTGFTDEQKDAVRMALRYRVVICTGGPGTGKSHTSNAIVKAIHALGEGSVECLAPTGRAAKVLSEAVGFEARTIHRALKIAPGAAGAEEDLHCAAVLLDESSMCDVRLMATLLGAIPANARLVLVGDADQLPSVGPGRVLCDLVESGAVPVARLTRVFRQDPRSRIALNCQAVNKGDLPDFEDASDTSFVDADRDEVAEAVERVLSDNDEGFDPRDVQVLAPMRKGAAGIEALNHRIQATLNPDSGQPRWKLGAIEIRRGDRVKISKNDYTLNVYNGEVGFIVAFRGGAEGIGSVVVDLGDREVVIDRMKSELLQLAWACTIHASQGSAFPAAIVVCSSAHGRMLSRQLLYTALSRPKKYCWVVGDRAGVSRAVENVAPHKRRTRLGELLKFDVTVFDHSEDHTYETAADAIEVTK